MAKTVGALVDVGIVPGVWFILLNGAGLIVPALPVLVLMEVSNRNGKRGMETGDGDGGQGWELFFHSGQKPVGDHACHVTGHMSSSVA
jgi:hypothetical protein